MRGRCRETPCQVTFLTPLLRGASEKPLSFASLPSQQDVTKQGMFAIHNARKAYISDVSDLPLSSASFPSHADVTKQGMFSSLASKRLIFLMHPSFPERACARNAEPGSVSDLLPRDLLLGLLISPYGQRKKSFAR